MGNSLFEQLKKSGLVDDKKAREVKKNQYKSKKKKPKKGEQTQLDETKRRVQQAHAERVERDRQLNFQRKAEAERKAIAAQVDQLVETNRVADRDGDIAYHFTDSNLVKNIHVSEKVHKHLVEGRLAIVKRGDMYELVPVPVAEKIRQRDETCVIMLEKTTESQLDEHDPYADYMIPDDLMW